MVAQGDRVPARRRQLPPSLRSRPFTRADAAREQIGRGVLRGNGVTTLVAGVYLAADVEPTLARRLSAYLTVLPPGTAVDSVTALRVWGVEIGPLLPYRFVTTAAYQSTRPTIRVRRVAELPTRRGSVVSPVPALVAAKTELELLDLVVAGDWLVRIKRATLDDVREGLTSATGRDCRRARRAGELVRAGAESPRESRLRLAIVLAGLPEPVCNVDLGDDYFFIGRVDLYLPEWNVAVEYEGDQHRTDPRVFGHDLERCEQLAASGVLVVRVSKTHLRRPRDVIARIHAALVSRGYRGPAPVFGAEWRAVFG